MKTRLPVKLGIATVALLAALLSFWRAVPAYASQPNPTEIPRIDWENASINPGFSAASGRAASNMDLLGVSGGTAGAVAVQGNIVFLGKGTSILILDISDPSAPVLIGSAPLPDYPFDIEIAGDYAYVGDQGGGLLVFDISNLASPRRIAQVQTDSSVAGLQQKDQYLLMAEDAVFRILDISNPFQPVEVSRVASYNHAIDVKVQGDYAFLADGYTGLRIFNISNIRSPYQVGSYTGEDYALDVEISGHYAYLADGYAGMLILDIQNPSKPAFIKAVYGTLPVMDISISGNYAYLNGGFFSYNVFIADISNPASAAIVKSLSGTDFPRFLTTSSSHLFLSEYGAGLHIFDIAAPLSAFEVGAYTQNIFSAGQVVTQGRYAYVAGGGGGLHILDTCDPFQPKEVGYLPGEYTDIEIAGDYAYLSDYNSNVLHIVDISQPNAPKDVNSISFYLYQYPRVARVSGDRLYVAAGDLYIFDLSDPIHPTPNYIFHPKSQVEGLAVAGHYAYLSERGGSNPGGLDIVDPEGTPHVVGSIPIQIAADIKVKGNYAYLARSDNNLGFGLYIIDISNPTAPFITSVSPTLDVAEKVSLYLNYAFVGSEFGGVYSFQVNDPYHPVEAGYYPLQIAEGVSVSDGTVYVANGAYGLAVLSLTAPGYTTTYQLCGTVADFKGNPIPDVSLQGTYSAVTDSLGEYYIGGIPVGSYTFTPVKPGYSFYSAREWVSFPPHHSRVNFIGTTASLQANYITGAPGSYFWFTGQGYEPNQSYTVYANYTQIGILSSDASGNFSFRINTDLADEGKYSIYIDGMKLVKVILKLSAGEDVHPITGSGPIFPLPSGIAITGEQFLTIMKK